MGYKIIMKSLLRVKKKVCEAPYEINAESSVGGKKIEYK